MAAWTLPNRKADWCEFLTTALDRRSRKYFVTIILGMLLASGRRTVSCWLRAVGVSDDWQDHYYFLQTLGWRAKHVATKLLHLAVKQIPVSHVGPYVKLALFELPEEVKHRGKGRPRKYGKNRMSLARRGGHHKGWTTARMVLYGLEQTVVYKTFLATYPPVNSRFEMCGATWPAGTCACGCTRSWNYGPGDDLERL